MKSGKAKEVHLLKEQLGSEITLYDENDQEHVFQLLLELIVDNTHYAYFQSPDDEKGDIEVLKVVKDENGKLELEYIEDDDEWEEAAELFDELTFQED
ncbi:MAG: DUF1292 domain-containing protein [Tepidibacillus sp.]